MYQVSSSGYVSSLNCSAGLAIGRAPLRHPLTLTDRRDTHDQDRLKAGMGPVGLSRATVTSPKGSRDVCLVYWFNHCFWRVITSYYSFLKRVPFRTKHQYYLRAACVDAIAPSKHPADSKKASRDRECFAECVSLSRQFHSYLLVHA